MEHTDFNYVMPESGKRDQQSVAVGPARPHVRAQVYADVEVVGARLIAFDPGTCAADASGWTLADVIVLDCPRADARTLAALAQLDMVVAEAGKQLLVWTTTDALDAVFGCLDQSGAQILLDPTPGEHVIALSVALAKIPTMRVNELTGDDRLTLLQMSEQVARIAARLDSLSAGKLLQTSSVGRLESPSDPFKPETPQNDRAHRISRPALPDPRLVRQIIAMRKQRFRYFGDDLFADPAWDILLDLTAARAEHKRVSVTSLCIASNVPPTTALRWIAQMTEAGLLVRVQDDADRRRAFIAISDRAADAMARYFAELGKAAATVI